MKLSLPCSLRWTPVSWASRFVSRSRTNNRRKSFVPWVFCGSVLLILWTVGILDHLWERPFSEFRWPPYGDVREQVRLEMNGKPSTQLYENDWVYFRPFARPYCPLRVKQFPNRRYLLIVVKSAAANIPNRDAIRATWGAVETNSDFTIRTVFLVGRLNAADEREELDDLLTTEARQMGDVLIGNYTDSYGNNIYKFLSAIQYAYEYCGRPQETVPFAFFVDDDYFVSIPNLVRELRRWRPLERLYMGWRFDSSPFRLTFFKHRVPLEAYPFDRYPPYISAGAVLLSQQSIREMYHAVQHTRLFRYDDIYAGILAHLLALPVTHNNRMSYWYEELSVEKARRVICMHGFGPDLLWKKYDEMKTAGVV